MVNVIQILKKRLVVEQEGLIDKVFKVKINKILNKLYISYRKMLDNFSSGPYLNEDF